MSRGCRSGFCPYPMLRIISMRWRFAATAPEALVYPDRTLLFDDRPDDEPELEETEPR